ncbi:unnamed protein product [Paramecium sonneborni]|uniref:Protein kinase domain-containing protein n=1 Tax=Paramecium sonneborni TaxID=65129 RepID=A0A8S1M204_9CILI|nr:unnamed protein product [Paramecium sonneborni]
MDSNQFSENYQERLPDFEVHILKKPKIEIIQQFQQESIQSFEIEAKQPPKSISDQTLLKQLQITQFTKHAQNKQQNKQYNKKTLIREDIEYNKIDTLKINLNELGIKDSHIQQLEQQIEQLTQQIQFFKTSSFKYETAIKAFVIELDQCQRNDRNLTIENNKKKLGQYQYLRENKIIKQVWVDGKETIDLKQKIQDIEQQLVEYEDQTKYLKIETQIESLNYLFLQREKKCLQKQLNILENKKLLFLKELKLEYDELHAKFKSVDQYPVIGERYILLSLLGKGGFSEVYKGYDLKEMKHVACKIHQLNQNWTINSKSYYVNLVTKEFKVHKELQHPNILKLYDSVEIDSNTFCTILEYCNGSDLSYFMRKYSSIQEREAKLIIQQLLEAVKYIHMNKIIHYDIKPQNILFNQNEVKLCDFGLCKELEQENSQLEYSTQAVGTYWYLPPECFLQENKSRLIISNKVDIWSIGVIFFEMLYGMKPFGNGESQETILKQKIILKSESVTFPKKPALSNECIEFIKGCLSYNQNDRFDIHQAQNHPYMRK